MKQQNVLLIAALAVGAYFLTRRPKRRGSVIVPDPTVITEQQFYSPESTQPADATIDADKQGLTLPAAIEVAKNVADKLKDVKIDIFKGGKKRTFRAGRKKVKLTAANKKYFTELGKKTGRKFSAKEQKQIKATVTAISPFGFMFK